MSDKTIVGSVPPTSDSDVEQLAPRVAFVGLCDRSVEITEGHEIFWHMNILGVSPTKVFNIFPVFLDGIRYIVAIYNPKVGERFTVRLRRSGGKQILEFFIDVGQAEVLEASSGAKRVLTSGEAVPGWNRVIQPFPKGFQVNEPGAYDLLLASGDREEFLGSLHFLHARAAPLTPESIAAIRSDPLATKLIRVEFTCITCGESVHAYAGLEKNPKLESEGWVWFEKLADRFKCGCGANDINLEYIRTGLPGLLSRRLSPVSDSTQNAVRLYEQSALEEQARNFQKLISQNVKEEILQEFLEQHPIFFSYFLPTKLMSKKPILTKYKSDFVILTDRKELLLIEIERATLRLLKKDGGVQHELQHAMDQVRDWLSTFVDHRVAALDAMGLKLEEVAAVKGVVIAGRLPHNPEQLRVFRNKSLSFGDIAVYTYDDLLSPVREIIRQRASV